MEQQTGITVRHAPDRDRYELVDGEAVIGAADYVDFGGPEQPQRIFHHTVVDASYAGQGLASRLVRFALDHTASAGLPVVTVCPFFRSYVQKHPEYRPRTVPTRPEHLAALPPQEQNSTAHDA